MAFAHLGHILHHVLIEKKKQATPSIVGVNCSPGYASQDTCTLPYQEYTLNIQSKGPFEVPHEVAFPTIMVPDPGYLNSPCTIFPFLPSNRHPSNLFLCCLHGLFLCCLHSPFLCCLHSHSFLPSSQPSSIHSRPLSTQVNPSNSLPIIPPPQLNSSIMPRTNNPLRIRTNIRTQNIP